MSNDVVMEDVSSEVGDGSRADNPTIKWVEIASALQYRIKKSLNVNVRHLDYDTFINDAGTFFEREIKKL